MKKIFGIVLVLLILQVSAAQAFLISAVDSQVIDERTATVTWNTDLDATSRVNYGAGNIDQLRADTNLNNQHSLTLTDLEPNTEYQYTVTSEIPGETVTDNNGNQNYKFTTPQLSSISNIQTYAALNSVKITWNTDIPTKSEIKYSTDRENLNFAEANDLPVTVHEITIQNLEANTNYFFQIVNELKTSDIGAFRTTVESINILNTKIPEMHNSKYLDVTGTTGPNSYVLLEANYGDTDTRYTPQSTGNSGQFSFSRVSLYTNANNNLIFEVTDPSGTKREYTYNVVTDTIKPTLTLKPLPNFIKDPNVHSLQVFGNLDTEANIVYTVSTSKPTEKSYIITNFREEDRTKGSFTLEWNKPDVENIKYYKLYRNGEYWTTTTATRITDHYIGSENIYTYEISMVNTDCIEGTKATLQLKSDKSDTEEPERNDFEEPSCDKSYQYQPVKYNGDFTLDIPLEEGINYISIKAFDDAGNEDVHELIVNRDTTAPEIVNVTPKDALGEGYSIIEGTFGTRATIEGDTDPFATVSLLLGHENGRTLETVTADVDGHFKFDKINIEQLTSGPSNAYLPVTPQEVEDTRAQAQADGNVKPDSRDVNLILLATDLAGQISQPVILKYSIVTCWSGKFEFDIIKLDKYQGPSILNPDRIMEGNEIITFYVNLTYTGNAKEWSIDSLQVEKMCDSSAFKDNKKFNISCNLLHSKGPDFYKSNSQNTLWRFDYNLKSSELVANDAKLEIKDLLDALGREIVFPFRYTVRFTEDGETDYMQKCDQVSYELDSNIPPDELLPDWLVDGSIQLTNNTIQILDQIEPKVKNALRIISYLSAASWATKTLYNRPKRKLTCQLEAATSNGVCPKPGKATSNNQPRLQDDLSDGELRDQCPKCYDAWQKETEIQWIYRWTTDRFLCHKTPSRWTESASTAEVNKAIEETQACIDNGKVDVKGFVLDHVKKKPEGIYKEKFGYHYEFDGSHYVPQLPAKSLGQNRFLFVASFLKDIQAPGTLEVVKIGPTVMVEEKNLPAYFQKKLIDDGGKKFTTEKLIIPETQCTKEISLGKSKLEAKNDDKYSYREDYIGLTCYNENVYFQGRDEPACFGQDNIIYKEKLHMLTPQQHTSAFQCMCVSGILVRLKKLRSIAGGLNNCFHQIKTTGEANAGVCKEIFTQYVCDGLWQLIDYFADDCASYDPTKGGQVGGNDQFKATVQSLFESLDESAAELNEEYGNAALEDFLGGGKRGIMRKVCLGALSGDWGIDFESVLDGAYSISDASYAGAWPATRQLLTPDLETNNARYEYRAAWQIMPGCEIDRYSVDLACINQDIAFGQGLSCEKSMSNENHPYQGCDCWELPQEKTTFFASGGRFKQSQFEDNSGSKIIDSPYRYDHVKVRLDIGNEKMREKCLPEGHKDGVWYFPIEDKTTRDLFGCKFDVLQGKFSCEGSNLLWDQRGSAQFIDLKEPKKGQVYNPGDSLDFRSTIFIKGTEDKCLWFFIKDKAGNLLGKQRRPEKIKANPLNLTLNYEYPILNDLQLVGLESDIKDKNGKRGSVIYDLGARPTTKDAIYELKFFDNDGRDKDNNPIDGKIGIQLGSNSGDQYRIGNAPVQDLKDLKNNAIKYEDTEITITNVIASKDFDNVPIKTSEFTVFIKKLTQTNQKRELVLRAELRHLNGQGECDSKSSTVADQIRVGGKVEFKEIPFSIEARTASAATDTTKTTTQEPVKPSEPAEGRTRMILINPFLFLTWEDNVDFWYNFKEKKYQYNPVLSDKSDFNYKVAQAMDKANPKTCKDFKNNFAEILTKELSTYRGSIEELTIENYEATPTYAFQKISSSDIEGINNALKLIDCDKAYWDPSNEVSSNAQSIASQRGGI